MKKKVYRKRHNKEITEEIVQVVANAIIELADKEERTVEDVVNDIVEESKSDDFEKGDK